MHDTYIRIKLSSGRRSSHLTLSKYELQKFMLISGSSMSQMDLGRLLYMVSEAANTLPA
jgi:hypothetical protein